MKIMNGSNKIWSNNNKANKLQELLVLVSVRQIVFLMVTNTQANEVSSSSVMPSQIVADAVKKPSLVNCAVSSNFFASSESKSDRCSVTHLFLPEWRSFVP
ncbi:hypothetical protein TNCV_228711 [Trichonephila clavipes]|nr:hypothetical protein TNCV_228711 [Trichonephila clavipes]